MSLRMSFRPSFAPLVLFGALVGGSASAQAYVLDFGSSAAQPFVGCVSATGTCNTFSRLVQSYGDVAGVVDVTTHAYDGGALSWWNTGYNELYGVAFNNASGAAAPAWIDLVPQAAGSAVTLTHFDLGGYFHSQRHDVAVKVYAIGSDTPLFSYTGDIGTSGNSTATGQHSGFDLNLSSLSGLRIQWADPASAGNIGIDNLAFSVGAPVPEPGTYALLLGGLAGMAWKARRLRTR